METVTKETRKLETRIRAAIEAAREIGIIASYRIIDESVQAELRLNCTWAIRLSVDEIHYPRSINRPQYTQPMWQQMAKLSGQINAVALSANSPHGVFYSAYPINAKTKSGPARRAEAKANYVTEQGRAFLAALRKACGKRNITLLRAQIAELQTQQKAIIPQMRAANSAYLAGKRTEKAEQQRKNEEALKSGQFWDASKEGLRDYFHPPFNKNHLADVSEKWRAALFTECESTGYKGYDGNWRHKLVPTGRGYLCGIDDNGDEWGHRIEHGLGSYDQYNNLSIEDTVEHAMSLLFEIPERDLKNCERQGDILFCKWAIRTERVERCRWCHHPKNAHTQRVQHFDDLPDRPYLECPDRYGEYEASILEPIELHPQNGHWEIRESHTVASPGMLRNGSHIRSANPIVVTHTSHAQVTLPPGDYRIYTLQVQDAD